MTPSIIVGTETQSFEGTSVLSGVPRVMRETHDGLMDRLSAEGLSLVPFHTIDEPRRTEFRGHPYFALDPVLDQAPVPLERLDVLCFFDLNSRIDFTRVYHDLRARPRPVFALVYDIIPLLGDGTVPDESRLPFRLFLQQLLRIADHVIVTCQKVKDDLLALDWHIRGQIHVIHLGSTFRPRPPIQQPDDRISLMYVSTVEPRKGHVLLLDAFDILRRQGADVDLTLMGRAGWATPDVFDRITDHPDFGGRLRWLQAHHDHQLAATAKRSTIGVFPSSEEGFGLFVEEGLALGLKMVARDIPVFRERAQENLAFHGPSPGELADAILRTHATPWVCPAKPVRTMSDFADDIADLVIEAAKNPGHTSGHH